MNIEIIDRPYHVKIYGFSGVALNKAYTEMAFKLSGKMWQTLKESNLKHKGQNVWVYEPNEFVFAGVELIESEENNSALQCKEVVFKKHAYFKHIGSYSLLKNVGQNMIEELKKSGFQTMLPYVEIYGHWNNDETKLETELLMGLK